MYISYSLAAVSNYLPTIPPHPHSRYSRPPAEETRGWVDSHNDGLHHIRETFSRPCQPISCIKPPGYSKYGATKSTNCSSKVRLLLLKGAQLGPGPSDSDMLFWSSACWFYCKYKSSRIISDRQSSHLEVTSARNITWLRIACQRSVLDLTA